MTRTRPGSLVVAVISMVALADVTALACPVCFQVEDGATASGVRVAVLVLIGVTLAVLAGFGWFVGGLVRRAATSSPMTTAPDAGDGAGAGPVDAQTHGGTRR